MGSKIVTGATLVVVLLLGVVSCERVIALDRGLDNAEGSTGDKQGGTDETATAGNPAEDLAEGPDSPLTNDLYSDATATSDNDTAAPMTEEEWEGENTSDSTGPSPDSDFALADSGLMPDEDAVISDTDTALTFSVSDCGCGERPAYEPVCCDGQTTVFNKCFANCLNYYTGQCISQQNGVCASSNDNGSDADEIEEVSDDDAVTSGSCECAPADLSSWCCEGRRYIGECTALCDCEESPVPCR